MANQVTLGVPEESWDEELTPSANPSNQELPTGGDDAQGIGPLMQATGGETTAQTEPEEEAGGQETVLQGVTHKDSGTNPGEAVGLDDPHGREATGEIIETEMTEGPEYLGVTSPGDVDESPEATAVPEADLPVLLEGDQDGPDGGEAAGGMIDIRMTDGPGYPEVTPLGADLPLPPGEYQDMLELVDDPPWDHPIEESLMDVPPGRGCAKPCEPAPTGGRLSRGRW